MENLFETEGGPDNPWDHWKNMPEYVSEHKEAYATVLVRFRNEEDLRAFGKIVDVDFTGTKSSIWYPKLERGLNITGHFYVDEDDTIYDAK
mgnify:CR=1 FL=1|jgi:hypothetical protein